MIKEEWAERRKQMGPVYRCALCVGRFCPIKEGCEYWQGFQDGQVSMRRIMLKKQELEKEKQ